ncbi:MAG: SGNH/GDSL hydrolase family protein [Anaerolineales bacterium]|nr:SGNH/GDSL hydrolase family protein [Anaerolineales bacterium]
MSSTSKSGMELRFLFIGLLLLGLGLSCNQWLVAQFVGLLGINLNLVGTDGLARLWFLKSVFVLMGLPLVFYKFRHDSRGRLLFDISMGLVFMLITLITVEGIFYALNLRKMASTPQITTTYSQVYIEPDEELGYTLKPLTRATAIQKQGDEVVYDVTYTTDALGRRPTPIDKPDERSHFILFFGGSYTFGDGLWDDETLPAQVGELAPEYKPYNYGVPGYGTQQLLVKLQSDEILDEVPERDGIAIYVFICAHIKRVVGTTDVQNTWGRYMPYYFLDANDQLVRQSDLVTARPWLSAIDALVGISQTGKYFNITLPRINDNHRRLTARIIAEAQQSFRDKYQSDAFYVLIYPHNPCAAEIIPFLEEVNVKVLDYSTLFKFGDAGLWIPDGHPTASAQKIVAQKLVTDLGLADNEAKHESLQ